MNSKLRRLLKVVHSPTNRNLKISKKYGLDLYPNNITTLEPIANLYAKEDLLS